MEKGDTLFCFTIEQARVLAGFIEKSERRDTLLYYYLKQQENLKYLLEIKDSLRVLDRKEITEKDSLIVLMEREKLHLENQLLEVKQELLVQKEQAERSEKKHRLQKGGLGLVIVLMSIFGLVK